MKSLQPTACFSIALLACFMGGVAAAGDDVRVAQAATPVPPAPVPATPPPPAPAAATPAPAKSPLRIATWSGAYGKAQEQTIVAPFKASSGVDVALDASLESGREREALGRTPPPDVIELGSLALEEACASGGLMKLDAAALEPAPNGAAANSDFLPGGLTDCGVASFAWSAVFVTHTRAFKGERPKTIEDVFNIWEYPGVRALPKSPKYIIELALLVDGVDIEEVHKLLETDEGVQRALARIDKLGNVVWWEKPSDAFAMLADGRAAIALGYSGRAFQEIARGRPYDIIWDRQLYEVSYFAVPASAAAPDVAKKFIAFATAPQRLAAQAKTWPYGPMRMSAVALADKHALLGTDLKPVMPTAPDNFARAVRFNAKWWAANEARLAASFDEWLKARPVKAVKK